MKINPFIFRAYDIRGIYPKDLSKEGVFQIVLAFAKVFPRAKKIVVARDSRLSSALFKKEVIDALRGGQRKVLDIGLAPDPLFSFALLHYGFDAGIMVTASHNPKQYNGLILNVGGRGISREDLEKIKKIALGKTLKMGKKNGKLTFLNLEKEYVSYVFKKIRLKKTLKLVFDCGNGAMGYLPEKIFKRLGCKTKTIFGKPDGNFPNHLPDPYLNENLRHLKKEVLAQKADAGFAFDGDGDRVVLVDNKGRRVSADYCLLLLAKHALERKKGPVVTCVRSSEVFLKEIEKLGVKTYFSVAHHNALIEKIRKVGAVFGGEITTHYFFPKDFYTVDDALFSALKLAEIVSGYDDFSKYIDSLPPIYATPEIFVASSDEEKFLIVNRLKNYLKKEKIDFIGIDGARILFKNGWALVRASNTSPFIKLRFEGKTKKDLLQVKIKTSQILKKAGISLRW